MKNIILTLSLILVTFTFIPSAQADHGQRFCRVERRCDHTGRPLYVGYGYSRQSSHYGPHYHTNYAPRSNYERDHQHRHQHSRSGGFRFYSH